MMQGDSYDLSIDIRSAEDTPVTPGEISDVELTLGHLKKTCSAGELSYDETAGLWFCPLTQQETFSLPAAAVKAQLRILWPNGAVEGVSLGHIHMLESLSKEVLA